MTNSRNPPDPGLESMPETFEKTWPLAQVGQEAQGGVFNVLTTAAFRLLARARQLSASKATDRQLAVVLALMACELHTEQGLASVMRQRGMARDGMLPMTSNNINLGDRRTQRVYAALTDDYPWGDPKRERAPAAWWVDWSASRALRHEVAHAGQQVTAAQAARCITASVSYMAHVSDAVTRSIDRIP